MSLNYYVEKDKYGNFYLQGSHDGFKKYGAMHLRKIYLRIDSKYNLNLILIDQINSSRIMAWRQLWHLGPSMNPVILNSIIKEFNTDTYSNYKIKETWHSTNFGKRIPRKSLIISGLIKPGIFSFKVNILLNQKLYNF